MDYALVVGCDGILRAKWAKHKELVPVKFIQNDSRYQYSDFCFWSWWSECPIEFEKGMTVGAFFTALAPWTDYFSQLTHKNLEAYLTDLVNLKEKEKSFEKYLLSQEFYLQPSKNTWHIHSEYLLCHKKKKITELNLHEAAHCLLIIGTRKLFINENKKIQEYELDMDKPHSFKNILEGFFQYVPHLPASFEEANKVMSLSMQNEKEEYWEDLLGKAKTKNVRIITQSF